MAKTSRRVTGEGPADGDRTFHRSLGVIAATAVNMTQMCGIGPA